ncbi:holin-associated N-acetylmuramidase [Aliiroseovarius lamellibrachiae]|uniref:holin-associated N-acetylmuramidase n=1 Tax=Aliiroseovarius lamellibrachiae TaxID=1924933 RepID=UPI001BE06C4B|nr:holin-associated N-acetylmuramidase [Aliiroseovarius lamellibrachiae]MBT2131209.1 peptidoglycan-binding protein [Aliiroseovarius lamellibrachiae]
MKTVKQIATEIVAREGGYVNDPDDPGGATNFGVTIRTMRRLKIDLDRDGDTDTRDVRLLTRDHAVDIFIRHYFKAPRIDLLPEPLQATVFDMQVNAGANAVKILQRLLGQFQEGVVVDGALGPNTAAAVARVYKKAGLALVDAYGIARRNYYLSLAEHRPRLRKFARRRNGGKGGWILRAEEFISPKYHLSAAQFQARVARWS